MNVPSLGVGLQYNPALVEWFPFEEQSLDALEILFDGVMGPLDGPGLMWPGAADALDDVAARFPLLGHSNYGGDFGFDPLSTTSAVRRHVPLDRKSTRLNSSHGYISYAVFCLKKKTNH